MHRLLADEIILRVFSYLGAADLARLQSVTSHFRTLAKDRHLWKRLFYYSFVRPTDGPSSRFASSSKLPTLRELRSLLLHQNILSAKHVIGDGTRQIHRLPRRFYNHSTASNTEVLSEEQAESVLSSLYSGGTALQHTSQDYLLDWEQLFRVSTNWQRGNFAVSELLSGPQKPNTILQEPAKPPTPQHTIVRVSNNFIFTSTSSDAHDGASPPSISVYPAEHASNNRGVAELNAGFVPKDLQKRTPIARFSSPALRTFLSHRLSHSNSAHAHVTEIAVDAAVSDASPAYASSHRKRNVATDEQAAFLPDARILVAYSTGHISIFSLQTVQCRLEANEQVFHSPTPWSSDDHTVMAALHFPALVLCSSRFDMTIYQVGTSSSGSTQLNLVQRMSSYRCSSPAALRLKKLPYHDVSKQARRSSTSSSSERTTKLQHRQEAAFRVTLAYSTPGYPSSWSISVQELVVRISLDSMTTSPVHVTSRHATAKHPFRPTPVDLRGRSMLGSEYRLSTPHNTSDESAREHLPNSIGESPSRSRTTSLTYDDPFVVVGASDNLLEVYELLGATTYVRRDLDASPASLPRPATATPVSHRDALRLVHRRSLHGHTGSVHSVALEDGRCVSGSADGSVMVWSLGDRSNETDSIASVMRNARRSACSKATGAVSTSSTILEEDEGDEAASHMTHVLTLRTPTEPDQQLDSRIATERYASARHSNTRRMGPSLGHLVRSRVLDRQNRGVIRWVSTAFDKIVSIVTYPDAVSSPSPSPSPSQSSNHSPSVSTDARYQRERVQVWSFG
ncbi:uncharacterized protein UTRI_05733 [Ustilago trichophora]|uniref:F-box domain-containing protein n=1 Tax=Ustilago trichophora TaxID=86804 RepID=A0A5C3EM12_9BASI|nr:uncharacterized protein UTRI_05733 [Ustilago trichophora]